MPSPHPESNPSDAAIAHLAHDLRNLLATARGHAELQGASAVASEYQELRQSLAAIGHASARAGALCEELLELSRGREIPLESLDLGKVAESAARLFGAHLDPSLDLELDGGPELMVDGVPSRLERGILNLLWNARDAVTAQPGGGVIRLSWGLQGDAPWLEVADNGEGLPQGTLGDLTEAFASTRSEGGVRGLGLHSVAATMAHARGRILGRNDAQTGGAVLRLEFPPSSVLV